MKIVILAALSICAHAQADSLWVDCSKDAITLRILKSTVRRAGLRMGDFHFNDRTCKLDGEEGDYFYKRIEPFTACGTTYTLNDTHVVYRNTIHGSAKYTGIVILGSNPPTTLSGSFTCVYNIDLRASARFLPGMQIMDYYDYELEDVYGEGEFTAVMALYTDERYHTPYLAPPILPQHSNFYVGVTMLGQPISSDIYLLIERCWATVYKDPESAPTYPLISEGCPIASSAGGSIRITENGVSHQALWQSMVFKFIGRGPDFNHVWLHCDLQLCIGNPCKPICDRKRRKRSADGASDAVVTTGPITISQVEN